LDVIGSHVSVVADPQPQLEPQQLAAPSPAAVCYTHLSLPTSAAG
jgi:hypothetical protein